MLMILAMNDKSLTHELAALREKIGDPWRSLNDALVARLVASGMKDTALQKGAVFPEFVLPTAEGKMVASSSLFAKGPAVISFYRGVWCPFCSAELEALHQAERSIRKLGASLVAISGETGGIPFKVQQERGFRFDILCDVDYGLSLSCGLVFRLTDELVSLMSEKGPDFVRIYGNDSWFLPIPATYIVRSDGIVAEAFVNPDFRFRLDPEDISRVLRTLEAP